MQNERRTARDRGDITYNGRPCRLGHTLRYTSSGACIACHRKKARDEQRAYEKMKTMTYRGKPCRRGHVERYVRNHKCAECARLAYERNRMKPATFRQETEA
jgi:hypothetical protein